jgi:hypothetical protein
LRNLIRNAQPGLLDAFLVSAAATVLIIRAYLAATNYPKLGGGGLHIAHVVWGGLGMMLAIGLFCSFLSRPAQLAAALVGGVGFGAFVDELGKFLTADNNYFFKPTAALIYTIFVILFLAARQIRISGTLSPEESLVNAIELGKRLALDGLSPADRDYGLALLAAADQANPLVAALRQVLLSTETKVVRPSPVIRLAAAGQRTYFRIANQRWFRRTVAAVFIAQAVGAVLFGVSLAAGAAAAALGYAPERAAIAAAAAAGLPLVIQTASTLLSGAATVIGVLALRSSHLRAYRAFELAVLLDLLLGQPFSLLDSGFGGLVEVFIDLFLLAALRYMTAQQRNLDALASADVASSGAAPVIRAMRGSA